MAERANRISRVMPQLNPEKAYDGIVRSTARFIGEAGFTDVVIGLSGGIDSSLVAVIAVDALGAEHVHGMLLPGPYSSAASIDDAEELAAGLGISTVTVPIDDAYAAFDHAIGCATGAPLSGLASENTQARCRMVCIMAASNAYGWMMLNTGNASEAAMGYSTLYGDTAGAYAPIGGLYKTEVYGIARWRNEVAGRSLIPESVLLKPPSAELAPDQCDEDSLGVDYATLDAVLYRFLDCGDTVAEMVEAGYPRSQVEQIMERYRAYAFKRAFDPPFPQVARI